MESPPPFFSPAPTISEIFSATEKRVWYAVFDGVDKSSEIYYMYVVENGTVTLYQMHHYGIALTLGDLYGYSDQAVINTVEDNVQHSFEEYDFYSSYEDARAAQIVDDQIAEFILNTDETGNNVISETVILQPGEYYDYTTTLNIANESEVVSGEVYDDVWRGFEMIPEPQSRMRYVVTRDESFNAFSLDDLDSPNVIIN